MPKKHDNDEQDVVFEEEEAEVSGFKGKSDSKLRAELKATHEEKQEYLDGWQRAKADLINFKREAEEAKKAFAAFATQDLIEELLPVLDSFDMALVHDHSPGIEHVHKQLMAVLKGRGVEPISAEGEEFNPNLHDSVEAVSVDSKEKDNKILDVVQKGYMLKDKVIRPARVRVGTFESN